VIETWGQTTTTLYERGTAGNEWTSDNLSDFTGSTLTLTDYGAYASGTNSSDEAAYSLSITENAVINIDAYWYGISNTGRAFAKGNGVYFRYGNIFVAQNDQDKKHGYGLNGIDNMASVTTFKSTNSYRTVDISTLKFLRIEIEVNTATNTLNYFRVSEEGSDSYLVNITDQTLTSEEDYTKIAFGYRKSGSMSTTHHEYLKSIKVTQTTQDVETADYAINYTYNGTTVKSVTGSNAVGSVVTADATVDAEDGTHYLLVADTAPTITLASGTNTLNVEVRKPYTATLNVTTAINGTAGDPVSTTFTETDDKVCSWSYVYPLYVLDNGVYCKAEDDACYESGTFTGYEQQIDKTITYTTDENAIYFGEWETDNTDAGSAYPTTDVTGFSNGKGKAIQKTDKTMSLTFTVASDGIYTLTMPYYNVNSKSRAHIISIDDEAEASTSINASTGGVFSKVANLTAGEHTVTISCVYSLTSYFDYLLVSKVPVSVTKTIPSFGYASFSSTYSVEVPSDVTVYGATVSDDATEVVLTKIETSVVPANTGVLLYSDEAGEKTLNVTTETATADFTTGNSLLPTSVEANATVPAEGSFYGLRADKAEFAPVQNGISLSADKAYLAAPASAAKSLVMVISGTTGISEVNAQTATANAAFYTLQGIRVAKPTSGLYICNGKKVIIKK